MRFEDLDEATKHLFPTKESYDENNRKTLSEYATLVSSVFLTNGILISNIHSTTNDKDEYRLIRIVGGVRDNTYDTELIRKSVISVIEKQIKLNSDVTVSLKDKTVTVEIKLY